MNYYRQPPRLTTYRIRRARVAGLLIVVAIAAGLAYQLLASSPSTASWSSTVRSPIEVPRGESGSGLGEGGGSIPDGTTVFDDTVPGVANLDADLRGALRRATTDAANGGIELFVDSGWRSPEYQERLRSDAVSKYGSEAEAARWVAAPDRSAHVSGDAVDIASAGATWLSAHGAQYGLCRIYGNEPWHFELRPEAIASGCPPMYADAAHDPRMQR